MDNSYDIGNGYCGIDPGLSGGIVFISNYGISTYTMPTILVKKKRQIDLPRLSEIMRAIALNQPNMVFVEQVHSSPQQGVTSAFTFGMGFGKLLGVIESMGLKHTLITPYMWKKHYGLLNHAKKDSAKMCKTIFVNIELVQPRCKKPHEGIAEAALIMGYGIHTLESKKN